MHCASVSILPRIDNLLVGKIEFFLIIIYNRIFCDVVEKEVLFE